MINLLDFDPALGYIGLFTISFVGSVIPFIPIPFFIFLAVMSVDPLFDPNLLALITAIGASIGKLIIFYGSYYGRKFLSKESKKRMLPLQRVVARYGWLAAFIAATTPVPDDIVYIPLGLSKYNPVYFTLSVFVGKMLITEIIVWGSKFGLAGYIQPMFNNSESVLTLYITTAILTILTGVIIYYMQKIDWSIYISKIFPWAVKDDDNDQSL